MLKAPGDADDCNEKQKSENHVNETDPYPGNEKPDDVKKREKTSG